jgi:hypothetical protein
MNVVALYIAPKQVKMFDDVSLQCLFRGKKEIKKEIKNKQKVMVTCKKKVYFSL